MTTADNSTLFVSNFSWNLSQEDMEELFSFYGDLDNVNLIMDRTTWRSKGFWFVKFINSEDAITAMEGLNEKEIDGRALNISIARPREEKPQS